MKVLLASSSLLAIHPLRFLLESNHDLVGVITMPDAPQGRGRTMMENEFAIESQGCGLKVFKPTNSDELLDVLTETSVDLVVTIAYGRLIRPRELSKPKHGWLNIHFSLLPRWRGAAPAQRAIEAGDSKSGITVFRLDEGLDTGPIYAQAEYVLRGDEDSSTLLTELSQLSVQPLKHALEMISEGNEPVTQSTIGVTHAPKLSKAEGRIDWNLEASIIERKIRACSPWPIAWTELEGQRISIIKAKFNDEVLQPGHIVMDERLIVGCGENSLEILTLKPEGKREMSATEWLRGARLSPDAQFE